MEQNKELNPQINIVSESNNVDDLNIFNKIINTLKELSKDDINRIIQMVNLYFKLPTNKFLNQEITKSSNIPSSYPTFSEDRSMSPKQFILDKNPVTDVERVACLAYYITHYRKQLHFKPLDISMLNTEAAQRKFANAQMAVANATTRGYLVDVGKGLKQLSAAGEIYVQKLPDKQAAQEVMAKFRKKKAKKTSNLKSSDN